MRDQEALLVSSRVYELHRGRRAVAIIQPVRDWKAELEAKTSMVISTNLGRYRNSGVSHGKGEFTIGVGNEDGDAKAVTVEGPNPRRKPTTRSSANSSIARGSGGSVVWGDFSPRSCWRDRETDDSDFSVS